MTCQMFNHSSWIGIVFDFFIGRITTFLITGLQDDQRYSQLLALRARTANGGNSALNAAQMNQLRNQIMAYRCLARNQPIPQSILMSLQVKQY